MVFKGISKRCWQSRALHSWYKWAGSPPIDQWRQLPDSSSTVTP